MDICTISSTNDDTVLTTGEPSLLNSLISIERNEFQSKIVAPRSEDSTFLKITSAAMKIGGSEFHIAAPKISKSLTWNIEECKQQQRFQFPLEEYSLSLS
jgi:hypothetical protein